MSEGETVKTYIGKELEVHDLGEALHKLGNKIPWSLRRG